MTQALTPPFLIASLVVCVAGASKLRAPHGAARALRALGLPAGTGVVRILAATELVLGAACVVYPSRAMAAVLAAAYATFAGVAAVLVGRRAACGCFGEDETPVSAGHAVLSGALAAAGAAAAVVSPRGVGWLASQPGVTGVALAAGVVGATYAVVLVYTVVPRAWGAWSGE